MLLSLKEKRTIFQQFLYNFLNKKNFFVISMIYHLSFGCFTVFLHYCNGTYFREMGRLQNSWEILLTFNSKDLIKKIFDK